MIALSWAGNNDATVERGLRTVERRLSLPVDLSSIGSVADRSEMPSDFRCARSAK
jgi:hypothetical protein